MRGVHTLSMAKAINAGLRDALLADEKVLLMGEDIGPLGGVFRVTEGLQAEFGEKRVLDTPLAESGIVGTAIGLAMRGYRPVIEIQFDGFIFPAFDQITTQLAKPDRRHDGAVSMPVVIRVPYGGHIGSIEHHQESPEAYFAHTPGLRVVSPSTPHDAYWMIQEAIASNDPVLFFEPKSRYWPKGAGRPRPLGPAAAREPRRPPGHRRHARRARRDGRDAAAGRRHRRGRGHAAVEVVDLRSLSPVDYGPLLDSVQRTGRLVVAQEAYGIVLVGSEIAATVAERAFYSLEAPVLRVSGFDTPFPPAALETEFLPSPDRVLEAVDRALAY